VESDAPEIPLQLSRGLVVASLQVELSEPVLNRFRHDLLAFVANTKATGVIMDLSGLEVVDASEFESLSRIISMIRLMGAEVVIAGVRPGVVASLVDLDVDTEGIIAAMNLDDAYDLFDRMRAEIEAEGVSEAVTDGSTEWSAQDMEEPDNQGPGDALSDSH
jgi:rsbT antagonist protein RsbS